jgi:hypothetical protein
MQRTPFLLVLSLVTTGVLASGMRADAAFMVKVTGDHQATTETLTFYAGSDPTLINFDSSGFFDDFDITGVNVTTNQPVTGQDAANITLTASVFRTSAGSAKTLTIEVINTDFSFPDPPTYVMTGSAGGTFTDTGSGDSMNYQMYADTTNAVGGMNVLGGFVNLADTNRVPNIPISYHDDAIPTLYNAPTLPYSLYTVTTITLGGNPSLAVQREIDINTSMLVAVPEPASLAMAVFGATICAGSLAVRRKRRRD